MHAWSDGGAGLRRSVASWHDPVMSVTIDREPPDAPATAELIADLEVHLAELYPAESQHGYSVERLVAEDVHVFVLRSDGVPMGCGGILFVDDATERYGEIKRMYVRPGSRGSGFGRRILERLAEHAREHGVTLLRLETGVHQREAIGLYESMGFRRGAPFGPYRDDPLSPCYALRLDGP